MIITITGDAGAGKSTLGEMLAEKLNFERYYMGQILRDLAKKKGMTLVELLKYGESHSEIDNELDDYQKHLGEEKENFIIEGRTSWFLIPHSIKLYIKVDPKVGAERIFEDLQHENKRNEGSNLNTVEDVMNSNRKRRESDDLRYKKYYDKDCFDENNFDLVVDTTEMTPEEVLNKILEFVESKK
ncbi:MAG: cytidylate kinase family protein [Candidatus Moranbacteria bacterium]|nr:cytidylate kinase family protein [Candidatus Moranbacteria bacterium]